MISLLVVVCLFFAFLYVRNNMTYHFMKGITNAYFDNARKNLMILTKEMPEYRAYQLADEYDEKYLKGLETLSAIEYRDVAGSMTGFISHTKGKEEKLLWQLYL